MWEKEGFLLIKCDPAVLFDRSNQLQVEECQKLITTIEKTGAIWSGLTLKLSETIQPRFQANKYLTAESIEDYQKHVRRLVKTAHKKGVEISKGHENELEVFSDLVALTEKRKQIHLRNYDYFKKIKDIYKEQAQFYFATLDLEKQIRTQKERLEQLENDLLKTPEHQKSRIRDIEQQKAAAKTNYGITRTC
nr:peptidoglycan bridge formation glycyltransferase FemA/FemB family protein [Streptococcus didelphis]